MGAGTYKRLNYFTVSFGKIRRKVDPGTAGAVERELKDKSKIWEIVYDYIEGIVSEVRFRQDPKFGNQWMIHIHDEGSDAEMVLQLPEQSSAARDFTEKFPMMKQGQFYRLIPFDFVDHKTGKPKKGMAISRADRDDKLSSFYLEFKEKPGGGWTVKHLHGYPEYKGARDAKGKADKDDLKVYFIELTKFLRTRALEHLENGFGGSAGDATVPGAPEIEDPLDDLPLEKDDLPF